MSTISPAATALWVLSALCLTSRIPAEAALAAPVLLILDLIQKSRRSLPNLSGKSKPERQPTGGEKRKLRRLNGQGNVLLQGEQIPTTRARWGISTFINLLLTLALLEQTIVPRLITCKDVQYARTSALSNKSARISLRLPGYDTSAIEYRPLVPGYPWMSTPSFHLDATRDWTADVSLDHLQPGIQYEYRAEGLQGPRNFTTFPDSRLEAPFRFVYAGQPRYAQQPYRPITHNRQATWEGWFHQIKLDRIRSSAWTALGDWLEDMDARTAWAATRFALIGDMPRDVKSRQVVAGSGKAYEKLPIMPSRVKSYNSKKNGADGSPNHADPEPAALTVPETQFSYAKAHFFRLPYPHREPHQDDQDWRVDVAHFERNLASFNTTDWKFIVTPLSLSPFFALSSSLREWQDAVLDILEYIPNVVVLSESSGDFRAEILRRNVIQVTSPSLDGGSHHEPDLTRAREEPVSTFITGSDGIQVQQITFEKIDRLLRHFPAGRANWLTVEVHGLKTYVVFVRDSEPIWRLEVVGEQPISRAVGTVGQSLQNLLRRLGLSTTRWF